MMKLHHFYNAPVYLVMQLLTIYCYGTTALFSAAEPKNTTFLNIAYNNSNPSSKLEAFFSVIYYLNNEKEIIEYYLSILDQEPYTYQELLVNDKTWLNFLLVLSQKTFGRFALPYFLKPNKTTEEFFASFINMQTHYLKEKIKALHLEPRMHHLNGGILTMNVDRLSIPAINAFAQEYLNMLLFSSGIITYIGKNNIIQPDLVDEFIKTHFSIITVLYALQDRLGGTYDILSFSQGVNVQTHQRIPIAHLLETACCCFNDCIDNIMLHPGLLEYFTQHPPRYSSLIRMIHNPQDYMARLHDHIKSITTDFLNSLHDIINRTSPLKKCSYSPAVLFQLLCLQLNTKLFSLIDDSLYQCLLVKESPSRKIRSYIDELFKKQYTWYQELRNRVTETILLYILVAYEQRYQETEEMRTAIINYIDAIEESLRASNICLAKYSSRAIDLLTFCSEQDQEMRAFVGLIRNFFENVDRHEERARYHARIMAVCNQNLAEFEQQLQHLCDESNQGAYLVAENAVAHKKRLIADEENRKRALIENSVNSEYTNLKCSMQKAQQLLLAQAKEKKIALQKLERRETELRNKIISETDERDLQLKDYFWQGAKNANNAQQRREEAEAQSRALEQKRQELMTELITEHSAAQQVLYTEYNTSIHDIANTEARERIVVEESNTRTSTERDLIKNDARYKIDLVKQRACAAKAALVHEESKRFCELEQAAADSKNSLLRNALKQAGGTFSFVEALYREVMELPVLTRHQPDHDDHMNASPCKLAANIQHATKELPLLFDGLSLHAQKRFTPEQHHQAEAACAEPARVPLIAQPARVPLINDDNLKIFLKENKTLFGYLTRLKFDAAQTHLSNMMESLVTINDTIRALHYHLSYPTIGFIRQLKALCYRGKVDPKKIFQNNCYQTSQKYSALFEQ